MKLVVIGLALATAAAPLSAQATQAGQVGVPDTRAGRVLRSWLDAFNSGDAAKMDAYYQRYEPDKSAEGQMPFRNEVGGFDLVSIEKSQPSHVEFLVKERKGDRRAFGSFDLPSESGTVKNFLLQAIPPGGSVADFRIDAAERARVIDGAIAKLDESYVFPETAKRMADTVRARQKRGEYDAVTNGASFARVLTEDFQSVSHDRHLRVNFSPRALPVQNGSGPTPEQIAGMRRQMEQMNCGFVKVEQLEGNVGYVKFNMFADPDICGPTATAAMNFVANSDALIIDLRDNGGGAPKMVAYICSYLFSQRTHLNDLWTRKTNSTQEFWTSDVPGKKLGDKVPVYVLTSKRTFSGAEEFTNNLKTLKRATIVGETTGGGAHPVNGQRIDEHFVIGVPFARAINPITKTNWEGTGVEPDVKVPASEALTAAQKLADKKPAAD
ncbi:MAG TPA: S41 family peptidase [Gemmatimonadaceae bacterium]|nr:S41 family peptidase [Gemmatimonadaceae bacterium]